MIVIIIIIIIVIIIIIGSGWQPDGVFTFSPVNTHTFKFWNQFI